MLEFYHISKTLVNEYPDKIFSDPELIPVELHPNVELQQKVELQPDDSVG